jgi:hypothetical protein
VALVGQLTKLAEQKWMHTFLFDKHEAAAASTWSKNRLSAQTLALWTVAENPVAEIVDGDYDETGVAFAEGHIERKC